MGLQYQSGDPNEKKKKKIQRYTTKRNFKMVSQVVFLKRLFQISNTKRANTFQRFLKVPMSPEVIFKILTTGTAQVLTSQNEHWLWTLYWPSWCKAVNASPACFPPTPWPYLDLVACLFPQTFTYLLQSHPGQSLILPSLPISSRFSFTKSQEAVRQYTIFLVGSRAKKQ